MGDTIRQKRVTNNSARKDTFAGQEDDKDYVDAFSRILHLETTSLIAIRYKRDISLKFKNCMLTAFISHRFVIAANRHGPRPGMISPAYISAPTLDLTSYLSVATV